MSVHSWNDGGGATVADDALAVDGARVQDDTSGPADHSLEFRATFSNAPFEHVGYGVDFNDAPWAMFSTGGGTGFSARTSGGTPDQTFLGDVDPLVPHLYRIEWSSTDVKYFVDGILKATHVVATAGPMRPVISDFAGGDGSSVKVDWLGLGPEPASGAFESRVFDAPSAHTLWNTLTPTDAVPANTAIGFDTRTGNAPVPDATWSAYQPVGAGGAVQSPAGRYLQYRAAMSSTDGAHTPSVDKVEATYDVDETAPPASIDGVAVAGRTATVSFSSAASDIARFECGLDGGPFAACTSPEQLTGLTPGAHTVAVRAVDKAANTGAPAATQFTVRDPRHRGGGAPARPAVAAAGRRPHGAGDDHRQADGAGLASRLVRRDAQVPAERDLVQGRRADPARRQRRREQADQAGRRQARHLHAQTREERPGGACRSRPPARDGGGRRARRGGQPLYPERQAPAARAQALSGPARRSGRCLARPAGHRRQDHERVAARRRAVSSPSSTRTSSSLR